MKHFLLIFAFVISLIGCFDPKPNMKLIESDLNVRFPAEYALTQKHEDWLGFDLTQEFTFQFDKDNFKYIYSQIESNESWAKKDSVFTYTKIQMRKDMPDTVSWSVEAKLNTQNKTLSYVYWEY